MFAWLRKWWHKGEVPPPPPKRYLDFPDEQEWVFDYDQWKWKAKTIPYWKTDEDEW